MRLGMGKDEIWLEEGKDESNKNKWHGFLSINPLQHKRNVNVPLFWRIPKLNKDLWNYEVENFKFAFEANPEDLNHFTEVKKTYPIGSLLFEFSAAYYRGKIQEWESYYNFDVISNDMRNEHPIRWLRMERTIKTLSELCGMTNCREKNKKFKGKKTDNVDTNNTAWLHGCRPEIINGKLTYYSEDIFTLITMEAFEIYKMKDKQIMQCPICHAFYVRIPRQRQNHCPGCLYPSKTPGQDLEKRNRYMRDYRAKNAKAKNLVLRVNNGSDPTSPNE